MTTTEVSMARVYNWDVNRRKAENKPWKSLLTLKFNPVIYPEVTFFCVLEIKIYNASFRQTSLPRSIQFRLLLYFLIYISSIYS